MISPEISDEVLVARMAAGHPQAMAELYDRHAGVMLAIACRVLRDRSLAEELLHDVFIEAYLRAPSFDPQRGSARAWLVLRVRSRAVDRLRTRGHATATAKDTAQETTDEPRFDALDHARVRTALETLPQEQRDVLELAYFEGLSGSEIAELRELPLGTVKSRTARALSELRQKLGQHEEDTP